MDDAFGLWREMRTGGPLGAAQALIKGGTGAASGGVSPSDNQAHAITSTVGTATTPRSGSRAAVSLSSPSMALPLWTSARFPETTCVIQSGGGSTTSPGGETSARPRPNAMKPLPFESFVPGHRSPAPIASPVVE